MNDSFNIENTFLKLNQLFEDNAIDNKVLVLDFSHFTKIDESHCNIKILLFGFENHVVAYKKALEKNMSFSEAIKEFSQSADKDRGGRGKQHFSGLGRVECGGQARSCTNAQKSANPI